MSEDLIKREDAIKIMACEMYAEAQSQGYDVDSIEDFMPEAKAWMADAPSIDIVRCGECRYWDNEPFDNKTVGRCLLVKDYMNMATIEEAYCFGGKRAEQTEPNSKVSEIPTGLEPQTDCAWMKGE